MCETDRFHGAARDGFLDVLQEANRKELNCRDDDGMTPGMWAAYYGSLDALRLIVGRGGDPDKCDYYGNTCLHCAAGHGHTECVSFLVNFGVNLWALDNDFHTAKDVAVLSRRTDVLRLLDHAQAKHELMNKKLVQRLKEKSIQDAERRIKTYRKRQRKASKKQRSQRKDSRLMQSAPKFSEIVNVGERRDSVLTYQKSTLRKKSVVFRPGDILRRTPDSDDAHSDGPQTADSGIGDDLPEPSSIFDRPGFGTVAFRRHSVLADSLKNSDSIGSAGSLVRRHITWEDECDVHDADDDVTDEDDIDEEDDDCDDENDDDAPPDPLSLLLASVGLSEYLHLFHSEQIDLDALSLLSEDDLKALDMPLGPRRKLGKAIQERIKILENPGIVLDSAL